MRRLSGHTNGHRGFTLVEMAIILATIGMLIAGVMQGQQLIQSARVRSLLAEQDAVATAVVAFQDRYQALPGDYRDAAIFLPCSPACPGGNGNGRIEDSGVPLESVLVWTHLSNAGFLNGSFSANSSTASVSPDNTPRNFAGGYLQVAFDNKWGYSTNPVRRHNVKTGNQLPVEILAEIDRKIDDGMPTSGRFQFSAYAGAGGAPAWGGGTSGCVNLDAPGQSTVWNMGGGQPNCGAASLL